MIRGPFVTGIFPLKVGQALKPLMLGGHFLVDADRPPHVILGPQERANHVVLLVLVEVEIASLVRETQYVGEIRVHNPDI